MTPLWFSPYSGAVARLEGIHGSRRLSDHRVGEPVDAVGPELTAREQEILAFERQWWKYAGAKEQAVRELFDMSSDAVLPGAQRPDRPAATPSRTTRCSSSGCGGCGQSRQRARSARRLGMAEPTAGPRRAPSRRGVR